MTNNALGVLLRRFFHFFSSTSSRPELIVVQRPGATTASVRQQGLSAQPNWHVSKRTHPDSPKTARNVCAEKAYFRLWKPRLRKTSKSGQRALELRECIRGDGTRETPLTTPQWL